MGKLAQPRSAIAYYGGKTSAGKRVDIDIDTPNIMLKINIRNKQGGVYPSHIMCDYMNLNLTNNQKKCLPKLVVNVIIRINRSMIC